MTDFDLNAKRAEQAAARAQAAVDLDAQTPTQRARGIAACNLCDPDGYTASRRVCDHQDHAQATEHGRALARAELDRIRRRQTDRARGLT